MVTNTERLWGRRNNNGVGSAADRSIQPSTVTIGRKLNGTMEEPKRGVVALPVEVGRGGGIRSWDVMVRSGGEIRGMWLVVVEVWRDDRE